MSVALVGCAVLAGWFLEISVLKSVLPGLPVMVPNTALAFVLCGAALWSHRASAADDGPAYIARVCALLVVVLAALTLVEYAVARDLGIDRLLLRRASPASDSALPGRMSPHTALSFLLCGVALYLLERGRRVRIKTAQALALSAGMIALLALVGYIYSLTFLYSITPQTGMAIHTALTFGVLSIGILFSHPQHGPMAIFTSAGVGGAVARPLVAAAVIVPLLLGWLTALGQRAGLYNQALGSSLLVVGSVVTFSILALHAARLLDQIDTKRRAAEEARTQLLKRLVAAQEEERARLSRELHDKMGQHLSALALNLELHRNNARQPPHADGQLDRLLELAENLSQEVRDLAWELRPPELDQLGLKDALACYVEQWSRQSGIPVDYVSTGDDHERLTREAETALYRVSQEALTNVLKHAAATNVTVVLERSPEQVVLVVEDDGCGFDVEAATDERATRKRLGLLGMKERVELAGGSFSIESSAGAGTTLVARVSASKDGEAVYGGE